MFIRSTVALFNCLIKKAKETKGVLNLIIQKINQQRFGKKKKKEKQSDKQQRTEHKIPKDISTRTPPKPR